MLAVVVMLNFTSVVKASGATQVSKIKIEISEENLKISNSDLQKFNRFADELAEKLKVAQDKDYERIIKNAYKSGNNIVGIKMMNKMVYDSAKFSNSIVVPNYSEKFLEDCHKEYNTDYNNSIIITPMYVIHNKLDVKPAYTKLNSKTKSRFASLTEVAYGIFGHKLFDVTVECAFNYNGKKAWYNSAFDYYYTRGTLSVWQVSEWRGWKEASGTSYDANCAGNFHWGLEYDGHGIIIEELRCHNKITCSKDGDIIKIIDWRK